SRHVPRRRPAGNGAGDARPVSDVGRAVHRVGVVLPRPGPADSRAAASSPAAADPVPRPRDDGVLAVALPPLAPFDDGTRRHQSHCPRGCLMTIDTTVPSSRPLRLWPGVAAAILLVLGGYAMPVVAPHYAGLSFIVSAALALVVILWWLIFSRARWYERMVAIVLIAAAAFAEKYVVHPSISGGGMGNMAYILVVPTLSVALVAWALVSRRLSPGARLAAAGAAVVLGCLPWTLLRTGGISGEGQWICTGAWRCRARRGRQRTEGE